MNKIKFFFDYTCPFCYIGLKYLSMLSEEYDIDISYISIITHSEIPDKGISLSKYYAKFEDVNIIYDYAKSLGEDINLDIKYFDRKYSSYKATIYGMYAAEKRLIEPYIEKIFGCVFKYNKNIASLKVLSQIYKELGLDITDAEKAVDEGKYKWYGTFISNEISNYNINTVPTFVINDKIIVGIHNINMYKLYLT